MTIGSLLASLTAATLGLAALSPHAAEAGDFPSLYFIKFRLEPIRPKLESYVGRVSSAPILRAAHYRHDKRGIAGRTRLSFRHGEDATNTDEIGVSREQRAGFCSLFSTPENCR